MRLSLGIAPSTGVIRRALDFVTTILMIVAALVLIRTGLRLQPTARAEAPVPTVAASLDGANLKGRKDASVALFVFEDFQCPFCAKFASEVLPQIEREYVATGRLMLAFRHFPLPSHSLAMPAAQAAECAQQQGRFWEMHKWLFEHPSHLDKTSARAHAADLGLDAPIFDRCVDSGDTIQKVLADASVGKNLGVVGTPAFLLGIRQQNGSIKFTDRLSGAQPYEKFRRVLDRLTRQ